MNRLALLLPTLVVLLACGGDSTGPASFTAFDIAGDWTVSFTNDGCVPDRGEWRTWLFIDPGESNITGNFVGESRWGFAGETVGQQVTGNIARPPGVEIVLWYQGSPFPPAIRLNGTAESRTRMSGRFEDQGVHHLGTCRGDFTATRPGP